MLEWTDPATREAVPRLFGGSGVQESWQALFASVDVFRRLAVETAAQLDYAYPSDLDRNLSQLIAQIHVDDRD